MVPIAWFWIKRKCFISFVPIENGEEIDGEFLKEMVRDANTTAVRRGDMLSYNIYLVDTFLICYLLIVI